jgi:predicted metal-binding membrane protein
MEAAGWAPCKAVLDTQKKKPRWAHVVLADATGELREGMSVALYFKQRDGTVIVAYGEVVKVRKDGTVRVRVPWFVAASLAAWAGVNIAEAGNKVELYECAVQVEILEEAAEERGGFRVKQALEEE